MILQNRDMENRDAAVDFMRRNPERFIESNTDISWVAYLISKATEGTHCDHLIIQAAADRFNLRICITESNPTFPGFTVVKSINS